MKTILEFPAKGKNNSGKATLVTNPHQTIGRLELETVTSSSPTSGNPVGSSQVNSIVFDLQEANELREWLNKNLPR